MRNELLTEIMSLPVDERAHLAEVIWQSIDSEQDGPPLLSWQKDEIDARLAEMEADPESGSTPEEVFARIRRRNS